jgi:hypothetical protein
MAVVGGVARASVGRQLLRGVGFFAGGASALLTVVMLLSWVHDDEYGRAGLARRLAGTGVVLALVAGGYVTRRQLRRWGERPRWLVPAAVAVFVVALVPAAYAPSNAFYAGSCVPILTAWEPAMSSPSAADLAYYESTFKIPLPRTNAQRAAFVHAQEARQQTPAYQRVSRFRFWYASEASCAPASRNRLGWSAAGLGVGAAALTVAVRRRRTG